MTDPHKTIPASRDAMATGEAQQWHYTRGQQRAFGLAWLGSFALVGTIAAILFAIFRPIVILSDLFRNRK